MAATLRQKARFFASIRPLFGRFVQDQVDGLEALLAACPPDLPTDHLAYCLATAYHETARTMQPIEEYGRGRGKTYGLPDGPYRQVYYGRGFVQLTWLANYRRATSELLTRGYLLPDQDMEKTPSLALRMDVAAAVLFFGSAGAWFTRYRLRDFDGPSGFDAVNARRIINGTDKAETIAGYHRQFRAALIAAEHTPGGVTERVSTPPVETSPLPTPAPIPAPAPSPAEPAKPGFLAGMLDRLRAKYPPAR